MRFALLLLTACGRIGFDASASGSSGVDASTGTMLVESFATTSFDFEQIPGATVTIPASQGKWLMLCSATLQSDSLAETGAEIKYTVDGIDQGIGGTRTSALGRPGPFQHFVVIDGKPAPQRIVFHLRDASGTEARVEQLRAYAIRIPWPSAQYVAADEINTVGWTSYLPHIEFTVGTPGEWLMFGLANTRDAPTNNTMFSQWVGAGVPAAREYQMPSATWQSQLTIWRQVITNDNVMALHTYVSGTGGSEIRYVRIFGVKVSDLALDYSSAPAIVTTTTEMMVQQLVPTISAGQYLQVSTIRADRTCDGNPVPPIREFSFGGEGVSASIISHVVDDCAYESSYGTVELLSERPARLTTTIRSGNGRPVRGSDAVIVLIGL
jgi:hypothetical protein